MFFVACPAVLTEVTQIKMAFAVVHARIHPSVHAHGCRLRAGYLMRSPAYPLYVKPLHCSTASGISAGTALFFSTTVTIDRLNLGQIPPVRRASHSHMHTPKCRMLRSRERRASESPPPNSHGACLCPTWISPSPPWVGLMLKHVSWKQTEKNKTRDPWGFCSSNAVFRLCCNLFRAETFLFVGAAATLLIKLVICRVWVKKKSILSLWFIFWNMREGKKDSFKSCYLKRL